MTKPKKKSVDGRSIRFFFLGLIVLASLFAVLLQGKDIALLNPKGLIAGEQHQLMLFTIAALLLIAVPTLFFFYFFAWKYRETNEKLTYDPAKQHGKLFLVTIWAIPTMFMIVLSVVMWSSTHKLEPRKAIASNAKPLTIQVIALRWKWLFIYPEQKIATVNFVQIPTGTPVEFQLTADDAPMSSFWIPHLAGQLYAMTGHINPLNLMAETPGDYPGSSAEINGAGFAGMKFIARASTDSVYKSWVQDVRQNSDVLDSAGYDTLLKPSENNLVTFYNLADADLYGKVVMKYMDSHEHQQHQPAERHTEHQ